MTKKLFFLSTLLFFFFISCTKNLDGIIDFKNWKLEWTPNFGLAVLNANISYNDLKNIIPEDSNFTVSKGDGDILVIHANKTILSVLNDFFVVKDFNYNPNTSLPIGGNSPLSTTIQIPFTELINLKGVSGSIQSIKFANGVINLRLQGNGVQNLNSINVSLGGVSSGDIMPTSSDEIIVPINLNDQTITVVGDNMALAITIKLKSGTSLSQASLSLSSDNLDLSAITVKDFVYQANSIETNLSMNFFDKINKDNPNFTLNFNTPVNLSITFNNQSNLNVSLSNLKATYNYKNGSTLIENITAITGGATNQNQSFVIKNLSNLLTSITFATNATISANVNPLTLSKTTNVELKGSVDIPLDVNIQGVNYEMNVDLPRITNNNTLNALENLTIKTSSNNEFPVELTAKLFAVDDAGGIVLGSEVDLNNIVNGQNENTTTSIDNEQIKKLVSTGKGKVVLGISTKDAKTGKFTTQQKLSLRLGLSIKANGKEILNSL